MTDEQWAEFRTEFARHNRASELAAAQLLGLLAHLTDYTDSLERLEAHRQVSDGRYNALERELEQLREQVKRLEPKEDDFVEKTPLASTPQ